MKEVVENAWSGWLDYTGAGRLAALLLLALLVFWFARKQEWNKYHKLFLYTSLACACCIFPITAAALMLYQTRFYDYQWIWGMVPITIVIALFGTLLWTEWNEKYAKGRHAGWKRIGIMAAMFCVLYFCGGMGNKIWNTEEEAIKQEETAKILEIITENGQNTTITLWAPKGIMEYARALNGDILLPYGRNMWDPALNAYSYDTYGERERVLYEWMCQAEETGEGDVADVNMAVELGVNHIILPENLQPELLRELEDAWGVTVQKLGAYYWLRIE